MVGGAIAAREDRLLALSPARTLLKGKAKAVALVLSGGIGAAAAFYLCLSSVQYVLAVKPLGKILVYGIPVGFGIISCRLIWFSSARVRMRLMAFGLTIVAVVLAAWCPGPREHWMFV